MSAAKNYWDSVTMEEYGVVSHETLELCRRQADRELKEHLSTPRSQSKSAASMTTGTAISQETQISPGHSSTSPKSCQKTRKSGVNRYEARHAGDENWFDPS